MRFPRRLIGSIAAAVSMLAAGQLHTSAQSRAAITPTVCHMSPNSAPFASLTAAPGQSIFQVVTFDDACAAHLSPVMPVTPATAAQYHLPASALPQPGVAARRPGPTPDSLYGVPTRHCRASQTMVDVIGLVLAETDTFQDWAYDGSEIVAPLGGHTGESWAPDGWWVVDSGFHNTYNGWPQHFQAVSNASFVWNGDTFYTEMRNTADLAATGNCTASFWNSGAVWFGGYHYNVWVNS